MVTWQVLVEGQPKPTVQFACCSPVCSAQQSWSAARCLVPTSCSCSASLSQGMQIQKGRLSGRMLWGDNQNLDMRGGKDPGLCFLNWMPSARWAVISVLCWKAASVSFVLQIATEPSWHISHHTQKALLLCKSARAPRVFLGQETINSKKNHFLGLQAVSSLLLSPD